MHKNIPLKIYGNYILWEFALWGFFKELITVVGGEMLSDVQSEEAGEQSLKYSKK